MTISKIGVAVAALALGSSAFADTIPLPVQTFNIGVSVPTSGTTTGAATVASATASTFTTLTFAKFNTPGGILNSIKIELLAPLAGTIASQTASIAGTRLSGTQARNFSVNGSSKGSIAVAGMPGSPVTVYTLAPVAGAACAANNGNGGVCSNTANVTANLGTTQTFLSPGFTGAGTFNVTLALDVIRDAITVLANSRLDSASEAAIFQGRVAVTYDYTMTPEPASFAMLGLAAVGFAAFRRRRRA